MMEHLLHFADSEMIGQVQPVHDPDDAGIGLFYPHPTSIAVKKPFHNVDTNL
jgi:hypothetical protein